MSRITRARRLRRAYASKAMVVLTVDYDAPRQWVALELLSWAIDYAGGGR